MANVNPFGASQLPLPHHPDVVLVDPSTIKVTSGSYHPVQFTTHALPPKSQTKKLTLKKQIIPTGNEVHLIPRLTRYLQYKHGAGNFKVIRVFGGGDGNSIEIWVPEPVTMQEIHENSRVNGEVFELRRHADGMVRAPLKCWEEKLSIWNQLVPKYWVEDWK